MLELTTEEREGMIFVEIAEINIELMIFFLKENEWEMDIKVQIKD